MKRNLLKVLPLLLLGGVLGLAAAPAAFETAGVKAEDAETKEVKFTSSKVKSVLANSYASTSATFTLDGVNFGDKNICYQGTSGSELIQIKSGTANGFWSTSSFDNYYISALSMTVKDNSCSLALSKTTSFNSSSTVETGSFSDTYTQNQGYQYVKIMSTGNTVKIQNLTITYSKNSDEPLPPFEGDYALVTDASTLSHGDKIVLGYSAKDAVAGTFGSYSYFTSQQGTFGDGEMSTEAGDEITLIEADGGWKLHTESEGYIGCTVEKSLARDVEDIWTITINDGIAQINNGAFNIKYNVNAPRFYGHAGDASKDLPFPEIYKAKNPTTDKFSVTYNGNGASGSVIDSNEYSIADEVTVLENKFTAPEGKVFKEWNTKADGSGTSYLGGATFSIVSDTTLYAIWKDAQIEQGNYFELVNSLSEIKEGDKILIGYDLGDKVAVNCSINGSGYFDVKSYVEENDRIFVTNSDENAKPLTLGVSSGYWTMTYDGNKTVAANGTSNNSLCLSSAKSAVAEWSISITSGVATITNKETTFGTIRYNSGGVGRLSNYTSTTMSLPAIYKRVGEVKTVSIEPSEVEIFEGQEYTLDAVWDGFTPSSFHWEADDDCTYIILDSDVTSQSLNFWGMTEGSATVTLTVDDDPNLAATCVVTVKPASESILDEGWYFITDNNSTHLMTNSIVDDPTVDLTNSESLWFAQYANEGENTYYIHNPYGYLGRRQSISGSGTNTELALSEDPVDYWTLSGNKEEGFNALCSSGSNLYLGPGNDGVWRAISSKTTIRFVNQPLFDKITYEVTGTPKTTYNVGDEFDQTGYKFYATFKESELKVEITSKITWDLIEEGTTATGKVSYGGVERDVVVDGLTITNYQPDHLVVDVSALKTDYCVGEKVDLSGVEIKLILKDGGSEKEQILKKEEYKVNPSVIDTSTEKIVISYLKDESIKYEYDVVATPSTYMTTNYLKAGEKVVIGCLSYDAYGINGGEEYAFDGSPSHASYDYSPQGLEEFTVKETSYGGALALYNESREQYLRHDGKRLSYKKRPSISVNGSSDNYDFIYYVELEGKAFNVHFTGGYYEDGGITNFNGGSTYFEGYAGDFFTSSCELLNDYTGLISFDIYRESHAWEKYTTDIEVEWGYDGATPVIYKAAPEETLDETAAFIFTYDKVDASWEIKPYDEQDVMLSYNPDGEGNFGFYSTLYDQVTVYRNNSYPLPTACTSISVDESTVKTSYSVNDKFEWTGLSVTAYYSGGISSSLPVGSYDITYPDMSKTGEKTITVSYGASGNVKTDTYTITVGEPTPPAPTIESVEITKEPTKLYELNETLVFDGEITAHMSDGSDVVLTSEQYKIGSGSTSTLGTKTVTINILKTDLYVQYKITVVAPAVTITGLELKPTKTEYQLNETYIFEGKAYAIYSDGSKVEVSPTLVNPVDTSTTGEKTVTLQYKDTFGTVSASYKINVVKPLVPVSATVTGQKMTFGQGEDFSKGNMVVTVTFDDESTSTNVPYQVDSSLYNKDVIGDYEIKVIVSGLADPVTYEVSVVKNPINEIVLKYESSKVDAKPGDTQTIQFKKPTVDGVNVTYDDFTYESSNENIATVTMVDGVPTINYLDYGTCNVSIKAKKGDGVATYVVNVLHHVEGLAFEQTTADINIGESFTINPIFTPENVDNKSITWTTSDNKIATVNSSGVVKGIKEGTVTITGTANDKVNGTFTATCTVVVHKIDVTEISLNKTSIEVDVNDKFELAATVLPDNASYKDVKWTVSDESVVEIINQGTSAVTLIAKKEGTATITASCDGKSITCNVTVNGQPTPPPEPEKHVESVSIQVNGKDVDIQSILPQETLDLTAVINPANADNKNVVWSSSNKEIVTVDARGQVTGVAPGTATITVKTVDGNKTDTITIRVVDKQAQQQSIIILSSVCGGAAVVGVGCGVGIPLGLRAKKRKLLK